MENAGVQVKAVKQGDPDAPDSLFPNNWFSTHRFGDTSSLFLYPMKAPNRQKEVTPELVSDLRSEYTLLEDLREPWISKGKALESTGCLIFDMEARMIYAAISQRCDPEVLDEFVSRLNKIADVPFKTTTFPAFDSTGGVVYHTNCMMAVLHRHIAICMDSIGQDQRKTVEHALIESKKEVLVMSLKEMEEFACNILCMGSDKSKNHVVAISQRAHEALRPEYRKTL